MVLAYGANHAFGIAQAGEWNGMTSVGNFIFFPGHPSGLKLNKQLVFSKQARSTGERAGRYGQYDVGGTLSADFTFDGLTKIFANMFATSTVIDTGNDFYTHTFTIDETGAFENPFGLVVYDNKDAHTQRNLSCHVKDMTLSFPAEPFLGFQATLIGASRSRISTVTPTPFITCLPFNPFGNGSTTGVVLTVIVDGQTYTNASYKQMTIKFTNPVELLRSANSQAAVSATRPQSKYQVEVSWTWVLETGTSIASSWLDAFDDETTGDLRIQLLGGNIPSSSPATNYSLTIDIDDLYIKAEDPIVSGPGEIEQTFTAVGAIEAIGGTTPFSMTLINFENSV